MNANVAVCRRALNISQSKMAKLIGVGLTSYNLKENGKSGFNQIEMIKILDVFRNNGLNVTADQIFFENKVINVITRV